MRLKTATDIASFSLATISLVAGLILGGKFMNITAHPSYELKDKRSAVSRRFGEAYNMLNLKGGFIASNYFTWFLFRRLLIICIVLYLVALPMIQISLHLLLAVIDLFILIRYRPFVFKLDMIFNILNSCFLLFMYILVLLIHLNKESVQSRESLGWIMILGIVAINSFNMLAIIIIKGIEMCVVCKAQRKDRKKQKEARYKLDQLNKREGIQTPSLFQRTYFQTHQSN